MIINQLETVGGVNMTIAFMIYGTYFGITGIMTAYYVKFNRNIELHKQWALRLYFLSIASILYRVWFNVFTAMGYQAEDNGNDFEYCNSDGTCPYFLNGLSQFNAWWFFIGGEILLEFAIYSKYWSMGNKDRLRLRNVVMNILALLTLGFMLTAPIYLLSRI